MIHRHKLVVYLGTDAMRSEHRVYRESKVKCRTALRHGLDFTLGSKDEYLRGIEIQFDGIEKVHRVGLRIIQYLLDGIEPAIEVHLFLLYITSFLVLPVRSHTLLSDIIHALTANLHLYPLTMSAHERHMQCLVTISFGLVHPIAEAVRMTTIELRESNIDIEALIGLFFGVVRFEDDAYGKDIKYLIESKVLGLHLTPYRIGRLDTSRERILHAHLIKLGLDGCGKVCKEFLAFSLCDGKFFLYRCILLRVLILEAEILELHLNLVQSETIGDGSIDIERLASNLVLLVGSQVLERTHIVQAVGNLNEDDADILRHGKEQLLEVLGLRRSLITEDTTRDLSESINDLRHLRAKEVRDILDGILGILDHIVQQCRTDGG